MSQPEWIGASNPMDEEGDPIEAEECDNERCYQPSTCQFDGLRYCDECFTDLFSEELYSIEAAFLDNPEHTLRTHYVVNADDDENVTSVSVVFEALETFNGVYPSTPIIVGIGRLMAEKEKAEAE